jgi:crotonobetainyl-CoA:carnitine CoA-transferase CaiB-like acyl-CoA transferase
MLSRFRVVEDVAADAPVVLAHAAAFAGRLAQDAGAWVLAAAAGPGALPAAERAFLGRGKHTAASPAERDAALAEADVVLCAGAPGTWPAARRPRSVIRLQLTPAGDAPALDELQLQAMSGLADLFGELGGSPLRMGGPQAASATGYAAFLALAAALALHELAGREDTFEVDALGALAWINWKSGAAGAAGQPITREGARAEWPVLRCADGHWALIFTEREWPALVELVGDPRLGDPRFATFEGRAAHREDYLPWIAAWAAPLSKAEITRRMAAAAIPSAAVLTPEDVLADPLVAAREGLCEHALDDGTPLRVPAPPFRVLSAQRGRAPDAPRADARRVSAGAAASADRADPVRSVARGPLAGVRVLDLGIITAGAGTGALLADLGADVVKVESARYPDPFRQWAGARGQDSPLFKFNNRNKRGAAIDLKTPAGRDRFLALAARADLVLENFRRGVMERLDLGYEALSRENGALVLASVSGQGSVGPGHDGVSFGSTLEAVSGIAALTGTERSGPQVSGRNLNHPDQLVCLYAAALAVVALLDARASGRGRHLDISQRDTASYTVAGSIAEASLRSGSPPPGWMPGSSPPGWATPSPGWMPGSPGSSSLGLGSPPPGLRNLPPGLMGNAAPGEALSVIIAVAGGGWVAATARTAAEAAVVADRLGISIEALPRRLADECLARARDEAVAWARALGLQAAPVLGGAEMFRHPWVQAGPAFARSPTGGLVKGFPFRCRGAPMSIHREAPAVGANTDEVLAEWLAPICPEPA